MIDAKYDDPKAAGFGHVRDTDLNADVGSLQICVGPKSSSRVGPGLRLDDTEYIYVIFTSWSPILPKC